jgi:hypothetical protein
MDFASFDTLAFHGEVARLFLLKYTTEQDKKMSDEERTSILKELAMQYLLGEMEKRSVWFMISEEQGMYYILLFYDNGYNQANGEDL